MIGFETYEAGTEGGRQLGSWAGDHRRLAPGPDLRLDPLILTSPDSRSSDSRPDWHATSRVLEPCTLHANNYLLRILAISFAFFLPHHMSQIFLTW